MHIKYFYNIAKTNLSIFDAFRKTRKNIQRKTVIYAELRNTQSMQKKVLNKRHIKI